MSDEEGPDVSATSKATTRKGNENPSTEANNVDHSKTKPASAWGTHDATEWIGIIRVCSDALRELNGPDIPTPVHLVVAIKETNETTMFQVLHGPPELNHRAVLQSYFQSSISTVGLYEQWSKEDKRRLARIAQCIPGVRLIDQDPWECLITFICSTNNNIPRITKMVTALRRTYGTPLMTIGDETLYSFPSFCDLQTRATDAKLRELGMGYRAKYIIKTLEILESLGGEPYLWSLREISDADEVQEKLIQFAGVGRKVADCVALFSLKQTEAVPVDVHVWRIARRDYDKDGVLATVKSITPRVYQQVVNLFRSRFTTAAGWAHSLLFIAELPSFRPVLPQDMVDEMEDFEKKQQK